LRDSYISLRDPRKISFLFLLSLGLFFYFANTSFTFAIESTSPLFQENQTGVSSQQVNQGQPLALPETSPSPSPGIFSTFIRLVLAIVLTVILIYATIWGLKIVWEKRGLTNNADETKPIKILTSTYLAPRKAIHLVEVGNRILVLGVGNDEITRLDVIEDPAEVQSIRQSTQTGFPNILERLINREAAERTDAETQQMIAEGNVTVSGYVEKLKRTGRKRKEENDFPKEES
jgi:flagellar biogenesis protein FliO